MRAVNLIPAEDRRGAGGAAGKSGGGAYVLLGGLAALVVAAGVYVVTGNAVDDKKAELARVTREAEAAEAQSQALASYTKFTAMSAKRALTVSQLADSRFDWSHALHEVARVLPENAWLTSLDASVSPTSSAGGGGSQLRGALAVPAISLTGCTTSQKSVAKMMARMRLIDGVQRVSLETAEKGDTAGGSASAGSGDCRGGHAKFPQFSMVVFFEDIAAVPVTPGAPASATTPASTSTATPASTSTPPATGGTTP